MNTSTKNSTPDYINLIVLIVVSIWVIALTGVQSLAHFITAGMSTSIVNWSYAGFPLAQTVLLLIPLLPLAIFWRQPRYKAIFQTWLLAAVFGVFMAPAFLPVATASHTQALLHAFFALLYAALAVGVAFNLQRRQNQKLILRPSLPAPTLFLALLVTFVFALPWLTWGALGSLLDTFLQLLAGLCFGLAVAFVLELFLFQPLARTPSQPVSDFLLKGFVSGTAIMVMISSLGFPFGVLQLMLVISLPVL